jgi:hypothetical protein
MAGALGRFLEGLGAARRHGPIPVDQASGRTAASVDALG